MSKKMSLVCTQQNEESSYYTIVRWTTKTLVTKLSDTRRAMQQNCQKGKEKAVKGKNVTVREQGDGHLLWLDHDLTPTATTVREIGVAMVARPKASKRWRLERQHGRRRPTTGVTTPEQQRPVRQEEACHIAAAIRPRRLSDNSSLCRTRLLDIRGRQHDSSSVQLLRLTPGTQRQHTRTAERQLVRLRSSSVTLRRTQRSDNFNVDCGYCRSPQEQLSYSSSVPITL